MRRSALAVLVLLAATPAALAQDGTAVASPAAGRLRVVGRGSVSLAPDFATVEIGVDTQAPTPAGALDANSAAAGRVIEAARASGIAEADVATAAVSLQPVLRTSRDDGPGTVTGYRAINTVSVRVRALDGLGAFLRRVVDGGANRIGNVGFGLAEPERAQGEAQAAAVRDARRQAEIMAGAAGVGLGTIESIALPSEASAAPPPYAMRVARPKAPVPIAAGSVTVEAEVAVTWLIAK